MLQPRKEAVPHIAVGVAEIVEEILHALVDFAHEPGNRRRHAQLQPCLTVCRLWHACAARILWRELTIDEGYMHYSALLRLASLLSPLPDLTASSSTSTMDTDDGNEPSDMIVPMPQSNQPSLQSAPSKADEVYRKYQGRVRRIPYETMVRSLSIIKMKQANVSEPVAEIGRAACHIEQVNIYICDHLDDYAITPFLQHGRLTHLSLAGCHKITDQLILELAATSPQLEHLDLRACGRVSDMSITAVARQCPRLTHLNVGRVNERHRITSESIRWVARHTRVAVLGLAGCDIDDETMILLAKHRNHSLERLSINSCHRISNATLRACVEHCPNISVFEMRECHLINDWEAIYELSKRKVVLTLCKQQERACGEWARRNGKSLNLRLARAT
ncbi:hypothetical protein BCR43DRAFT_545237 [Syncephalastrum racemosum]|uniref:F-box/LRR-repeat protein 15-like leucin rich repeat domain-containing protein n=1 Tax=Syncephalastrum racemosum TaxID=13706 RepID=A0A1X2HE09_SYNRA|nr:hypothetical protein BCR43DRAFT_545237 [Syncephalastrum racemosum]